MNASAALLLDCPDRKGLVAGIAGFLYSHGLHADSPSWSLHCLVDLLERHRAGELACDIPLIVSNHTDAEPHANFYNLPFHHIPVDAAVTR